MHLRTYRLNCKHLILQHLNCVSIGCFCAQLLAPWCKEYELCVCIDVTELLSDMLDSRRLDADRGR
ncbi:unnamed protein product [Linum tenue]|nr:unnamed protein product [Linum tenue]